MTSKRLFHSTERHDCGHDKRRENAWASWDQIYAQGVVPVHVWEYPRTAKSIGDHRALPFLKDVLSVALNQACDEDIVFFTNDDVVLHSGLPEMLQYHCSVFGPCSSQRREFKGRPIPKFEATPAEVVHNGRQHMGRDLFAATKAWWTEYWDQIPDAILGASMFDLHLACVIRKFYGIESTRRNLEEHISPAEIPLGYVSHRHHPAVWSRPQNDGKTPSELHNRMAFRSWASVHLPKLKFDLKNQI